MWVYVVYGARSPPSTARVARAIARSVEWSNENAAQPVSTVSPSDIRGPGLVFLGCASGGSELDRTVRLFLDHLPGRTIYEVVWAVFDTRPMPVPLIAGSGIRRLRRAVEHRGGKLLVTPQSFFADESRGGVGHDELERARSWASTAIAAAVRRYGDPSVRSGALTGVPLAPAWESWTLAST